MRVEAAHALSGSGSPALRAALGDGELVVRYAAAAALADADASFSPADPVAAARALSGPPGPGALDSGNRLSWLPSALRLGVVGDLVASAKAGAGSSRLDAIAALGRAATPQAVDLLDSLSTSDSEPEDIRKAAFRAKRRAARLNKAAEAQA